jgi:uncharacterized protein (TIGR03083 family)
MTDVTPGRFLDVLRTEADRLRAAAAIDLDAGVPSCPGWTARDVVVHTGEVYRHKVECIRQNRRPDPWPPEWQIDDPISWFSEGLDSLLAELTSRDPSDPAFTWYPPDQTVGFWMRRMAQETVIHRGDAEQAVGDVTAVEPDIAVDGIDEVLTLMLSGDWSDVEPEEWGEVLPERAAGRTVSIRVADRLWRLTLSASQIELSTEPGPSDATVTGEPSELLLWLWGRRPLSAVQVTGDEDAVLALRERLELATQ